MWETSGRLLRLLGLLQTRRDWSGSRLASRLDVTTRTVRRDIERLRALGYPVTAGLGPGGGYRLAAGTTVPPLLLDDEEAVAVAVGLRTATAGGLAGADEAALRAGVKLEHMLPARLRHRVHALEQAIVAIPPRQEATPVDPDMLTAVSAAIRVAETLRFDYTSHEGNQSRRQVEPHRVASWGRRWYLIGWDTDRADWRTFRLDRIALRTPNGPRFTHRDPPAGDVTTYLRRRMGFEMWPHRPRVRLHAAAEDISEQVQGIVTPIDEYTCRLELATDSLRLAALVIGMLDVDFVVESPPELAEHLRKQSDRFANAAGDVSPDATTDLSPLSIPTT